MYIVKYLLQTAVKTLAANSFDSDNAFLTTGNMDIVQG